MSRMHRYASLSARWGQAFPLVAVSAALLSACGGSYGIPMGRELQPAQPVVAGSGCQTDTECKGDRVCKEGACVPPGVSDALRASIQAGDISTEALSAAVQSKDCLPFSGLEPMLQRIADKEERVVFMGKLSVRTSSRQDPGKAFGSWLLLVDKRSQLCPGGVTREQLSAVADGTDASVTEKDVDEAVRNTDCSTLASINSIDLWPFEQRFVSEVAERRFQEAEVTRRLWLDTLETFEMECHKRLTRRESTEVNASADKLRRIVGLDDDLLIGLRTKLMSAVSEGHADEVQKYLSAVTEREKALDGRNAAMYEAKMRTIKAELADARAKASAASSVAATTPRASANGVAPASGSGASAAGQVKDAVETTKAAADAVNVARSIFGF